MYQIWLLNSDYTAAAFVDRYIALEFMTRLNDVGSCRLDLHPRETRLVSAAMVGKRLRIIRGGSIVWQGIVVRREWVKEADAARDTFSVFALDYAWYAAIRITPPPAGTEYQKYTDHADDIARAIVRANMGTGAATARQFSDLSVEADTHSCASLTFNSRYDTVLSALMRLAAGRFDWQFVPTMTGCEFQARAPYWGLDRTKGNGINDEFVMAVDRHNIVRLQYMQDISEARNYVYVAGQGEGIDRTIVERAGNAIAGVGRLEAFHDQRQLQLTSSLQAAGDAYLTEHRPLEVMGGEPARGTWRAGWDIGDVITFYERSPYATFACDAKIVAVRVRLDERGETVEPEFEIAT